MTGLFLVDKEQDWTSSDVVAKLRGVFRERRIGHAGTLDPMATGLLLIMTGRATRASDYAMAHGKTYIARMRTGITTDTQDTTGTVIAQGTPDFTDDELQTVLSRFMGRTMQLPPMYSAIKVNGKKLYEIARRGGEVERKQREINISELSVLSREGNDVIMRVSCSSGTYIRTLCSDIGDALGCGACMAELRRTRLGDFNIEEAHTVSQLEEAFKAGEIDRLMLGVDRVFARYPSASLPERDERAVRCGNPVKTDLADGKYRIYSQSGEFLMLAEVRGNTMRTEKSFFEV